MKGARGNASKQATKQALQAVPDTERPLHRYRLTDGTGHWVARLYRAIRAEFDLELKKRGVTITEWALLASVHRGDASTPSEVAAVVGLDRAVVTRALDRAVRSRLAIRTEGEDRRSLRIRLTAKGKQVATELLEASKRVNNHFFRGFSNHEEQTLRDFIDRALANRPQPSDS